MTDESGLAPVTHFVPPSEPKSSTTVVDSDAGLTSAGPSPPESAAERGDGAIPPVPTVVESETPGSDAVAQPAPPPDPPPITVGATVPSEPLGSAEAGESNEGGDPQDEVEGVRVIAVANQKGGVGKSTTSVNLGAALAEVGQRVLVVDLDPQGNASTGMGIDHSQREVNSYGVLTAGIPAEDAIVDTAVPNLSAIPSTIDLAGAEIELVSQFSRETRLSKALDPIKAAYDFVILDCPPSLGLLTVNALTASTELIVPIQCEYYALEGLGQLLRNVRLVQQNVNPRLRLSGIVMTMFDSRTKLAEQVVEEVRRYFGSRVYDTIIPRTVRLSEAPGYGQPITVYDSASKGAECYRALAQEVLVRPHDDGMAPVPIGDVELPTVILPARTEEEQSGEPADDEEEPPSEPAPQPAPPPDPGPEPDPPAQPPTIEPPPRPDQDPDVIPGPQAAQDEGTEAESDEQRRRRGLFRRREGGQP